MDDKPEFLKKLEARADRLRDATFKIKEQPMSEFGTPYGGFQRRLMAATIDTLVISFTLAPLCYYLTIALVGEVNMNLTPLMMALEAEKDPEVQNEMIKAFLSEHNRLAYIKTNLFVNLSALFLYCMIFWNKYAATPGKLLFKLQVLHEKTGDHLSYMQGFWRCVGYMVLGFVWISFSKRRQGWHDLLASSVVIVKPKKEVEAEDEESNEGEGGEKRELEEREEEEIDE